MGLGGNSGAQRASKAFEAAKKDDLDFELDDFEQELSTNKFEAPR